MTNRKLFVMVYVKLVYFLPGGAILVGDFCQCVARLDYIRHRGNGCRLALGMNATRFDPLYLTIVYGFRLSFASVFAFIREREST